MSHEIIFFVGFYGSMGLAVGAFAFLSHCGREKGRKEMFEAQVSLPYPKWYRKWVIENDKDGIAPGGEGTKP